MTGALFSSTPPTLPPTSEDDRIAALRLLRSRRVGVSTYYRLLEEYRTPQAALEALPEIAATAGVHGYEVCPEGVIHAELKAARTAKARLLVRGTPEYPIALDDVADAPPLLWAVGDTTILQRPIVALVGARNASSLGTRTARKFAAELGAAGYVTVSGLARGIDAVVHSASLATGTIGVLGGGVDVIYPRENTDLFHDVGANGLRLSEQPMGLQPQARHFPARNRIISGMARAVIVIEAAVKSGSLITADTALSQGRDVMAVPGHPFDGRAGGCNALIRDGAALVRSTDDILAILGEIEPPKPATTTPAPQPTKNIAALHSEILSRLGPSPVAEDQLIRDLGVTAGRVAPALMDLELDGRILRQPGGLVCLSM